MEDTRLPLRGLIPDTVARKAAKSIRSEQRSGGYTGMGGKMRSVAYWALKMRALRRRVFQTHGTSKSCGVCVVVVGREA